MRKIISAAAAVYEFLDWWRMLLTRCALGSHEWSGFTDGRRTLFICGRCLKKRMI